MLYQLSYRPDVLKTLIKPLHLLAFAFVYQVFTCTKPPNGIQHANNMKLHHKAHQKITCYQKQRVY